MTDFSPVAFDVEATGAQTNKADPYEPSNILSYVVLYSGSVNTVYDLLDGIPRRQIGEISDILGGHNLVIGANLSFDLAWARRSGIVFPEGMMFWDLSLAEYILNAQLPSLPKKDKFKYCSLDAMAERRLGENKIDKMKQFWEAGYDTDEIPKSIAIPYTEQDGKLSYEIFWSQYEQAIQQGQLELIMLKNQMLEAVHEMEYSGLTPSLDLMQDKEAEADRYLAELTEEMDELVGYPVNWGSVDQKSAAIYGGYIKEQGEEHVLDDDGNVVYYKSGQKKGLPKTRKCVYNKYIEGLGFKPMAGTESAKEGVYKADKDTLAQLKAKNKKQRRFKELMEEWSKYDQVNKMYYKGLQKQIRGDNMIHPKFNQWTTNTGRLSSEAPNGQNLSKEPKKLFGTRF